MGVKILPDTRFIHIVRLQLSVLGLMKEFTHCVHDLSAATIAEGDREMQSIEMGGFLFGGPDPLEGGGREGVESADRAQPDTLLNKFCSFRRKVVFEQAHERGDFLNGTVPILL